MDKAARWHQLLALAVVLVLGPLGNGGCDGGGGGGEGEDDDTNIPCSSVCDWRSCGTFDGCVCGSCPAGYECINYQCEKDDGGSGGLVWENPPSEVAMTWTDAKAYCEGLGWQLPSISQLRTLISGCSGTITGGTCKVTDDCLSALSCWTEADCTSCVPSPGGECHWQSGMKGACDVYWSSSLRQDSEVFEQAWWVGFQTGNIGIMDIIANNKLGVRCVH